MITHPRFHLRLRSGERLARDRGSASVEMLFIAPLLVLMVLLTVGFGRLAAARIAISDAAYQAARAASLARHPAQGTAAARENAHTALTGTGRSCTRPTIHVDDHNLVPGARTSARVSCTADLADVFVPGLPGTTTLTATATSVIDTHRAEMR